MSLVEPRTSATAQGGIMAASSTIASTRVPFKELMEQELLSMISRAIERAKHNNNPFVYIPHSSATDAHMFFNCVVGVANAMDPPPRSIAPFQAPGSTLPDAVGGVIIAL